MRRSVFPAFFCLLLCAASGSAETFEQLAARATSARDANDIPRALAAYRQALQVKPDWAEGWWFLGTLAYDADQYQQGRDAFAHFVKLDANAAPGWSLLGLCEFETGEPSAALEHIQRGLRLSAGSQNDMEEVLRFHEAMLLTRTGLFDQALGKYIWFARRGIHNPQLLVAIGMAALRQPLLPKDLTGDGPDAAAAAGAAAYAWMGSNFHDADESFRVLLARFPSVPNVHYFYASYLLPSRPELAMAELRRELEVNPGSADARAMIALAFLRHDDPASGFPYAKRAAQDGPSTPMAQYIYGLLLSRQGDVYEALGPLETAARLDPANIEYHMALATAYSRAGRSAAARSERLRTLTLAQEDSPRAR